MRYRSNAPVTVFETSNPAILAVAKSLLEDAEVPFFAKGEAIQQLGIGIDADPVELQVSEDDAPRARAVLVELARRGDER